MSNKLELITNIVDQCSKEHLTSVFAPIADLPNTSTKAEMISHCLNKELAAYGFETYTSPDKTMVLVNDETMCKIADFLNGKGYQPYFTKEQLDRLQTLQKVSNDNKVNIYWVQSNFRKNYYYLKQYGFNAINLYNILNLNTLNGATAALSPTGAVGLTIGGLIAISWSGSLFFATVENYIPNHMVRTKLFFGGAKCLFGIPLRISEFTANTIFSAPEMLILGTPLPINVTETYRLHVGPKLTHLPQLKKSAVKWVLKKLQKYANE